MSGIEVAALAVVMLWGIALQAQITLVARSLTAWRNETERARRAAEGQGSQKSTLESTPKTPRPRVLEGVPGPTPSPRIASPDLYRKRVERELAQKAQAERILRRAAASEAPPT